MYHLAVFKSRNQTIKFGQILSSSGISNRIVNTPKEAGLGCGLSVMIKSTDYYNSNNILSKYSWSSWSGWIKSQRPY